MPRNGSGTYTLAVNPIGVTGQVISLANFTSEFNDLATALTGSLASNGETTITGQLKGSASSSPCYAFAGDLTSGLASPGAGTYNLMASGANVISYTPTGVTITGTLSISVGFTTTVTCTGSTVGFIGFESISTEAAAAAGPIISTYRNSASPAASDFIGAYDFYAQNSTPAKKLYARIGAQITDATAATEDAIVYFQSIVAGALTTFLTTDTTGALVATTGYKVGSNPTATVGKAPTYQIFTSGSSATYTKTTGVTWVKIRGIAGGGGGGGTGNGGTGGSTIWDVGGANVTATGGGGGGLRTTGSTSEGTAGASGTGGAGTATLRLPGAPGSAGSTGTQAVSGTSNPGVAPGGAGGSSVFGGAGGSNGGTPVANSGAGAGGTEGQTSGVGGGGGAGGGGAGEYFELIIAVPSASYLYTVGAGGTAGTGGVAGATGRIIVEEYYS